MIKAEYSIGSNEIKIITNDIDKETKWSCKVDGNFTLDKYSGIGNSLIRIDTSNIHFDALQGTVFFAYGDNRCKAEEIQVQINNPCFIKTIPSYIECQDEFDKSVSNKIIYFYYTDDKEVFYVKYTLGINSSIKIDGDESHYISLKDKIMFISSDDDTMFTINIVPYHYDGDMKIEDTQCDNKIYVIMKKKVG